MLEKRFWIDFDLKKLQKLNNNLQRRKQNKDFNEWVTTPKTIFKPLSLSVSKHSLWPVNCS